MLLEGRKSNAVIQQLFCSTRKDRIAGFEIRLLRSIEQWLQTLLEVGLQPFMDGSSSQRPPQHRVCVLIKPRMLAAEFLYILSDQLRKDLTGCRKGIGPGSSNTPDVIDMSHQGGVVLAALMPIPTPSAAPQQ